MACRLPDLHQIGAVGFPTRLTVAGQKYKRPYGSTGHSAGAALTVLIGEGAAKLSYCTCCSCNTCRDRGLVLQGGGSQIVAWLPCLVRVTLLFCPAAGACARPQSWPIAILQGKSTGWNALSLPTSSSVISTQL